MNKDVARPRGPRAERLESRCIIPHPERVSAFVTRYEARTGERAAISEREARGDFRDSLADA